MKSGAKALSENGTDITVTGRLEINEENGFSYLHLVDAEVLGKSSLAADNQIIQADY